MSPPASLRTPGLDPVWDLVRQRLERQGAGNRGRVRLPDLAAADRLTLASLLGVTPRATLDLTALSQALTALGIGSDLETALTNLGFPVSPDPARRRGERAAAQSTRDAARSETLHWSETWASDWIDEVIRVGGLSGLGQREAVALVRDVRRVLDRLDEHALLVDPVPLSRVDLAAQVLGSAHALDGGTRMESVITRALAWRHPSADAGDLWEMEGAHLDLTSGPVLTWNLPASGDDGLSPLVRDATNLGVPVHLSRLALVAHPFEFVSGGRVLVVENPRVVEAAVHRSSPCAVVSINGNPSGAARLLIAQLLAAGVEMRYHGDFDAAGLAICGRMDALGLRPWAMNTADYLDALAAAVSDGVSLPLDPHPNPSGSTPWDEDLAALFDEHRRIVHEERLLPGLLTRFEATL